MTTPEPQLATPQPSPPFQFSLRTLLLLFVVLGSSLGVFGGCGIVVFGLIVWLAVYLRRTGRRVSWGQYLLVVLCVAGAIGLLALALWLYGPIQERSGRHACFVKLQLIGDCLEVYYLEHGSFPPTFIADQNGKPLQSWRLLLLKYTADDSLYENCDLTQPWDAPKNGALLKARPSSYMCPNIGTTYVAVVGENAAWSGVKPKSRSPADFPGGPSNTILLIELPNSGIHWAEPRDLSLDSLGTANASPLASTMAAHQLDYNGFFFYTSQKGAGVHVLMADGQVRFLKTDNLSDDDLRKILEVGGCAEGKIGARLVVEDHGSLNWPNIAALAVWLLSVGMLLTRAVRGRTKLSVPPPAS